MIRLLSSRSINFAFVVFLSCVALSAATQAATVVVSSAIDANGVRHSASDYPKGSVPWVHDQVRTLALKYPPRASHYEGEGLFRVVLDLRSGSVAKVTVLKSTGFKALDDSAIAYLSQWRWRPGKWKEIYMPVKFTNGGRLPNKIDFIHQRELPSLHAR